MNVDGIKTICAVGTGAMGAGTALCFAQAGYNVNLYGRSDSSLESAFKDIEKFLKKSVEHDLIRQADVPVIMARIKPTKDLAVAAKGADFVIESVAEKEEIKKDIFGQLDKLCPPHTIFATNTSSLSPSAIASALTEDRASKFVVTHLFNPPPFMPVAEIVPGRATSAATVETASQLMQKIGKEPVPLKIESPGFVVNVVQVEILKAACELKEKGHAPTTIDRAVEAKLNLHEMDIAGLIRSHRGKAVAFPKAGEPDEIIKTIRATVVASGARLDAAGIATPEVIDKAVKSSLALRLPHTGPLTSADLGGLHIFDAIYQSVGIKTPDIIAKAVAEGNHGAKTGQGIYTWEPEKHAAIMKKRSDALIGYMKDAANADMAAAPMRPSSVHKPAPPNGLSATG